MPVNPPLPPPRPGELLTGRKSDGDKLPPAPPRESKCHAQLEASGAVFTITQAPTFPGVCAIDEPVGLTGVISDDGAMIALEAGVIVRCAMAVRIANWVRRDLTKIVERHGAGLRGLSGVGGHQCRGRNQQEGARISEHAMGNAFDVRGLVIAGGGMIELMQTGARWRPMLREIRESACAHFTTVLGAGADAFHEDHLHVDLRERRGGFRLCQWRIPELD